MYERILEETIAKTRMADFEKQQNEDKINKRLRESENNKRKELEEKSHPSKLIWDIVGKYVRNQTQTHTKKI